MAETLEIPGALEIAGRALQKTSRAMAEMAVVLLVVVAAAEDVWENAEILKMVAAVAQTSFLTTPTGSPRTLEM
eukprot:3896246-Karenia_brevis.AAC.1